MPDIDVLTEHSLGGLTVVPVAKKISYLNMLVYGDPGVGKTVLAGSAQDVDAMKPVLFVDIEGGTFSIRERYPDVDVVRVESWKDMQKVYDALFRGDGEYKTIVLDSLTEIQKFSMYNIMNDLVKGDPDRDPDIPGLREWGKNIEQVRRLVRGFRDLPMNTIFTALAVHDKDPRTNMRITRPSLSGKLSSEAAGFVDVVAFMYVKIVSGEVKRLLLTTGTDTQVAKDRSDHLPTIVEDPVMGELYELIFNQEETK